MSKTYTSTSAEFVRLKGNDCPICNGSRNKNDCRSSGELIHCYSHNKPPAGYESKGLSEIGASLYAPIKANSNGFDHAANREARLAKQARQQRQVVEARRELDALPSLEERDRKIRSYPQKLTYAQNTDLLRRGLTQDEINFALANHWLFGLQSGYGISAIDPTTGLLCGAQKARDDRKPKYDWSIFARRNHLKETGENPLFVQVSPNFDSAKPYQIKYCEGALKSYIRACFEWRSNAQIIVIGASGGIFGANSLERVLSCFPNATSHTLLCDKDSQNIKKLNLHKGYGDLVKNIPSIKFADWGQWHDKSKGDCDEIYGTDAFNGYALRSPKDWLRFFEFEQNLKIARQRLQESDLLTADVEISEDEFRELDFDSLMALAGKARDIFIKAATGVGKTELAAKIVAMFIYAIAPFHRRSLAQSGSIRLGLTYRTDCDIAGKELISSDGSGYVTKLGLCNEAILGLSRVIDGLLDKAPIAFGDEFDHQLESLALSSTHGKDGRRRIHTDTFWQIFTRAIQTLITSADITDYEVNQFHKKTGRKPFVIRVTPVKKTYKTFLYEEFADAWQTISELRSQGKRGLILCTRKADADFLKFAFGAVAVTADNANDYRELLDDPNVWLEREKPILMSVSPVLGIGFSITHDAFDYVFGWFRADNIGAKGLIQFLNRYRLPCDRYIFCDYSSNRFEGITPDELYKNRLAKAKANQIIAGEERFVNPDDPSFHYQAANNWSLAYLRADLLVRLQQDVEDVEYVRAQLSPDDRKALLEDFNQSLKAYRDQQPINIFEARNLSITEYLALKDRQDLSEGDRLAVAKFEIADWSCISPNELTLERVQRDRKGKKRNQLERIEMQAFPQIATVKDKSSYTKQTKHGAGISHQDISHHALRVQELEEIGINQALDYALGGGVWGDDTPEIVAISDKIRTNNKALKKLGINLQVAKNANNSRIFGGLLDYFGVKRKRSQKRIDGKVVSFHRVCNDDLALTKDDLIARLPRNIEWYGELIANAQNPFSHYIYGCHTPFVNNIDTKVCDSTQSIAEQSLQAEIPDPHLNDDDWQHDPVAIAPVLTITPSTKAKPTKGDRVLYVGSRFRAQYAEKQLVVADVSSDGFTCELPDGKWTTWLPPQDLCMAA